VLTDGTSSRWPGGHGLRLAWSGGPYRLWEVERGQWALLSEIRNPNGLELIGGVPFFWMGKEESVLEVVAGSAGEVTLTARAQMGPSVTGRNTRHLQVRGSDGSCRDLTTAEGSPFALTLPVPAGKSTITLVATDQPTVAVLANGDCRTLLLGVEDLRLDLTPAAASAQSVLARRP
jgi:hypothetical protein